MKKGKEFYPSIALHSGPQPARPLFNVSRKFPRTFLINR